MITLTIASVALVAFLGGIACSPTTTRIAELLFTGTGRYRTTAEKIADAINESDYMLIVLPDDVRRAMPSILTALTHSIANRPGTGVK